MYFFLVFAFDYIYVYKQIRVYMYGPAEARCVRHSLAKASVSVFLEAEYLQLRIVS